MGKKNSNMNGQFMSQCKHLNAKMRRILIDWIFEVSQNWSMEEYTVHLCVYIIDSYLHDEVNVERNDLQKIGISALHISCKIEERYAPSISDFVHICDNQYTDDDIVNCERMILKSLDYDLMKETFPYCRDRICKEWNDKSTFYMNCLLFEPTILYEHDMVDILESCVALTCNKDNYWSQCMEKIKNYICEFEKDVHAQHVFRKSKWSN